MRLPFWSGLSALALLAACPALAQTNEQAVLCANDSGKVAAIDRIGACTALLADKSKTTPQRSLIYIHRAWSYGLQQEWPKALADYDTALKGDPGNSRLYNEKGLARLRMGRFAEAIINYDRAIKLNPAETYSIFGRGIAKGRLGQTAAGASDLAAARKLDAGVDAVFENIGVRP